MTYLLSIDPGLAKTSATGWAFFWKSELQRAGLVRRKPEESPFALARRVYDASWGDWGSLPPDRVVIEMPRSYDFRRQEGDQNDLLNLAVLVGAIGSHWHDRAELVPPSDWKGQVPKDIMVERIQKKLSSVEHQRATLGFTRDCPKAKSVWHNGWDAVGLGLWRVGR